jgi:phospholipase/lecithinase/hemolysin
MMEYTTTVNTVFQYRTPYEILVSKRYPGAEMVVFDVHSLMTDIFNHPGQYLNGTTPPNVTGQYYKCDLKGANCKSAKGSPDAYLWWDELHPTARVDQIIAREFIKVVGGTSKYAVYWK